MTERMPTVLYALALLLITASVGAAGIAIFHPWVFVGLLVTTVVIAAAAVALGNRANARKRGATQTRMRVKGKGL